MFFLATIKEGGSILGLFENNFINWLLLVGLIIWLWNKYMPSTFASRETSITEALQNASQAKAEGEAFLAQQKAKLDKAEHEADKIIGEAKQVAIEMQKQIEEQTTKELADMSAKIIHEIEKQRQIAVTELRVASAKAAIRLSHEVIPQVISGSAKTKLVDQFVDQLDSSINN